MTQLVYRCRYCGQDELRETTSLDELDRDAFDELMLYEMREQIVHDCSESGTHRGVCDLAGVIVTANGD